MTAATDWRDTTIGALATVSRGASPRPIASTRWFDSKSDVRWVRIADVNRSDGRTLYETTQSLSPDGVVRSRLLEPGTLIMSIAATVGIPVITGVPACIHDGFVALEDLKADKRFLLYLLKASERRLREAGQSGSQMNVNTDIVRGLSVCIPSDRAEQECIAAAIWAVDDQIAGLDRLIAKKQAIKQGMVQQILDGKVRLPGFSTPWRRGLSVLDLADKRSGYWGSDLSNGNAVLRAFVIRAGDISPDGYLIGRALRYFTGGEWKRAACRSDDVVITASGNGLGKTYYVRSAGSLAASNFVRILRPKGGVSGEFLAYVLKSDPAKNRLETHTATSAYPNLMPSFFSERWLAVPDLAEQRAIAQALRSADEDIDLLRERLRKALDVKHGMMQELLTGRTRLPIKEGVA